MFVQFVILKCFFKISPMELIKKTIPAFVGSILMALSAILLQSVSSTLIWQIISIIMCMMIYFVSMKFIYRNLLNEAFKILGFDIGKVLETMHSKMR